MSAHLVKGRFDEVVAHAVIGDGRDLVAGLVLIALGQILEDIRLGVGQQMVGIAEGEGIIGHADWRIGARREGRAGDDDVDRAERQALVDVGFLAKLRGRVDIDRVAAVGALGDLAGSPDGFGVERLGRFVDVRPLYDFLRVGSARHQKPGSNAEKRLSNRAA
jgi:hypothetical protein